RHRRARAENRRHHAALDRSRRPAAARARQRRRVRHAARHAGRAARRQQTADHPAARDARPVRRARRRGERQPDRELDRRSGAAHLVSVRGLAPQRGVISRVGYPYAATLLKNASTLLRKLSAADCMARETSNTVAAEVSVWSTAPATSSSVPATTLLP